MQTGIGFGMGIGLGRGSFFSPASIFGPSDDGVWLDPSAASTLFSNSAGSVPARLNESVKYVADRSGKSNPAVISASDSTCRYFLDDEHSKPFIRQSYEANAERLTIDFGGSLGSDCTIVFINATSLEFRVGQTIGSNYEIPKSFWGLLIINRALTLTEITALTMVMSPKCPDYIATYDFFAAANGNDGNDGLTFATPKTLAGAITQLKAAATGKRLAVLSGSYIDAAINGNSAGGKTQYIHCPYGPVIFDAEEPGDGSGGTTSCFDFSSTWTAHIYGEGNLTVQNYGNNGFGASVGAGHIYDAHATNCNDGFTNHFASTLSARRCTSDGNGKSAVACTGDGTGPSLFQSRHGVYYSKTGSALGMWYADLHSNFDCYQDDFLPDPSATTSWAGFSLAPSATAIGTATATNRKFRECRYGAAHLVPPATKHLSNTTGATFEDCYFNGYYTQGSENTALPTTFTRCFGPHFTNRARRMPLVVFRTFENCVFTGASEGGRIFANDFYSAGTDEFGAGIIRNCIIKDAITGLFVISNLTPFNNQWLLQNNLYHGNTTHKTVGVIDDGTDVVGLDPLILSAAANSDMQADWKVTAGSPSLGAGVGGVDIGLGLAA